MNHIKIISDSLALPQDGVKAVINLLGEGATIPFISRYRKEQTGSLDEVAIFRISEMLDSLLELDKRKAYIIKTIEQQGELTDDLRQRIDNTADAASLEDIFLPFKPKRRNRAQIARERGLEPLAKIIMAQNRPLAPAIVQRYVNAEVKDSDEALAGASDIIAEWISENQGVRNFVRRAYNNDAEITVTIPADKQAEAEKFLNYKDHTELLRRCPSHRLLAILRGSNEGVLRVKLDVDDDFILDKINNRIIRHGADDNAAQIITSAVKDGYKRLIKPSIETEMLSEAKKRADESAITIFADNLRQLLLASPLGKKRVLAIDPGFRTGCKVVCLDESGKLLHNDTIYPTAPKNDIKGAARRLSSLVEAYKIDAIALGNGTASRETERFLKNVYFPRKVDVFVVDESGASIYSASAEARREFPDKDVTVRGAVSIGRRLIDPLAELVKIDPKSIGVGQYQHDVDQKKLKTSLDHVVEMCVNSVGVNLNTASESLLAYVSGIGPSLAANIVAYRDNNGLFRSLRDLLKVERFGNKAFEQSAGFFRLPEADNILDNTAVHPESYHIVERMAKDLNVTIDLLVNSPDKIAAIDINRYVTDEIGLPTLTDIIEELKRPGRDSRKTIKVFSFDESIHDIADLQVGMILPGIVTNVTDFGAFVDLGIHTNGLLHISEMSDSRRVAHPSEVVKVHQHLRVKVIAVDLNNKRISLSLKGI